MKTAEKSLRELVQKQTQQYGFSENIRQKTAKIYYFEGMYFPQRYIAKYDIKALTDALFGAAVIGCAGTATKISTTLCGECVGYINRRLYEILICAFVCSVRVGGQGKIAFIPFKDGVLIRLSGDVEKQKFKKICRSMKGLSLSLRGENICAAFVPFAKENGKPPRPYSEYLYLSDRFSVMNIFCFKSFKRLL